MNQLFDKYINIDFFSDLSGSILVDSIVIPETGIKPNITLSATFVPSEVISNVEVRIVNYYPSSPLSSYKWMTIRAGYKHSELSATLSGQVKVAYQESPSPDGITLISMIVGNADDFLNREVNITLPGASGKSTNDILTAVKTALGSSWNLVNNGFKVQQLDNAGFNFQGKVKDCMNAIKDRWKIAYMVDGHDLILFIPNEGRTGEEVINISYLSSPPQATASGITFVSPWIPALRPGRIIQIDPLYFRQSFGAANVTINSKLITQTVSLQYNTVTNQNSMTVLALNTYEVPQASGS